MHGCMNVVYACKSMHVCMHVFSLTFSDLSLNWKKFYIIESFAMNLMCMHKFVFIPLHYFQED